MEMWHIHTANTVLCMVTRYSLFCRKMAIRKKKNCACWTTKKPWLHELIKKHATDCNLLIKITDHIMTISLCSRWTNNVFSQAIISQVDLIIWCNVGVLPYVWILVIGGHFIDNCESWLSRAFFKVVYSSKLYLRLLCHGAAAFLSSTIEIRFSTN